MSLLRSLDYIDESNMKEDEDVGVDFHGYTVFKDGKVFGKRGKYLKPYINRDGYKEYSGLKINGKLKGYKIHRLLAIIYIPNPHNLPMVDHIDRNRLNNDLSNLRWVTPSENNINRQMMKANTSGYRNISNCKIYYSIKITRNKEVFKKTFSKNKYTLDYVVRYRNNMYEQMGIEIDD